MSEFISPVPEVECETNESEAEMEERHDKEMHEMEEKIKLMIKQAAKSKRAEIECQGVQMKFDLRAKHMSEIERFEELCNGSDENLPSLVTKLPATQTSKERELEEQKRVEEKRAKAKRKKDKKADKDAERQQQKEELRATSGSSARDVELGLLSSRLAKDGFKVALPLPVSSVLHQMELTIA